MSDPRYEDAREGRFLDNHHHLITPLLFSKAATIERNRILLRAGWDWRAVGASA